MPWYIEYFLLYLVVVNIIGIIMTISDKISAKLDRWRISEKALMICASVGAGLSMYLTMLIIRHKTQHPKFMIGIPAILAVECIIALAFYVLVTIYA